MINPQYFNYIKNRESFVLIKILPHTAFSFYENHSRGHNESLGKTTVNETYLAV